MADHAPSIEKLRDEYVELRAEHHGFSDLYAAEFDRALAAHDREIAAQTLEDAAANCGRMAIGAVVIGPDQHTREWLLRRAAAHREGDS